MAPRRGSSSAAAPWLALAGVAALAGAARAEAAPLLAGGWDPVTLALDGLLPTASAAAAANASATNSSSLIGDVLLDGGSPDAEELLAALEASYASAFHQRKLLLFGDSFPTPDYESFIDSFPAWMRPSVLDSLLPPSIDVPDLSLDFNFGPFDFGGVFDGAASIFAFNGTGNGTGNVTARRSLQFADLEPLVVDRRPRQLLFSDVFFDDGGASFFAFNGTGNDTGNGTANVTARRQLLFADAIRDHLEGTYDAIMDLPIMDIFDDGASAFAFNGTGNGTANATARRQLLFADAIRDHLEGTYDAIMDLPIMDIFDDGASAFAFNGTGNGTANVTARRQLLLFGPDSLDGLSSGLGRLIDRLQQRVDRVQERFDTVAREEYIPAIGLAANGTINSTEYSFALDRVLGRVDRIQDRIQTGIESFVTRVEARADTLREDLAFFEEEEAGLADLEELVSDRRLRQLLFADAIRDHLEGTYDYIMDLPIMDIFDDGASAFAFNGTGNGTANVTARRQLLFADAIRDHLEGTYDAIMDLPIMDIFDDGASAFAFNGTGNGTANTTSRRALLFADSLSPAHGPAETLGRAAGRLQRRVDRLQERLEFAESLVDRVEARVETLGEDVDFFAFLDEEVAAAPPALGASAFAFNGTGNSTSRRLLADAGNRKLQMGPRTLIGFVDGVLDNVFGEESGLGDLLDGVADMADAFLSEAFAYANATTNATDPPALNFTIVVGGEEQTSSISIDATGPSFTAGVILPEAAGDGPDELGMLAFDLSDPAGEPERRRSLLFQFWRRDWWRDAFGRRRRRRRTGDGPADALGFNGTANGTANATAAPRTLFEEGPVLETLGFDLADLGLEPADGLVRRSS